MRTFSLFFLCASLLPACGGSTANDNPGSGAKAGTGGFTATGGSGGASASGGTSATGGSGGSVATGGAGGSTATGGTGGVVGPRCGDADFATTWKLEEVPNSLNAFGGHTSLSGAGPDTVHLVVGAQTGAWERKASGWSSIGLSLEGFFPYDVVSGGPQQAWVSSTGNMIANYYGTWTPFSTPVTRASLWLRDDGVLVAAGDGGAIAVFQDGSWQSEKSPTTAALRGVHGTSASDAFAVGLMGTALHRDANGWSEISTPVQADFAAVWATAPGEAIAVGADFVSANGDLTIVHFTPNGATTMPVTTQINAGLVDVWAAAPDDAFAVGGALLLHWDGQSWKPLAELESTIESVWGSATNDVYIALNGGSQILHCHL